jgi:hypothetical protein
VTDSREHITCQEIVELVTDYFEGALAPRAVALFEQHLSVCEGCDRYIFQMRTTVELAGKVGEEEDLSPEFRDRLMTAFRGWKRP